MGARGSSPTAREQHYHINEQEWLAVVWATRRYRPYLEGKPFTLRTDSKSLTWLETTKDQRVKLTRWALKLEAYSFRGPALPEERKRTPRLPITPSRRSHRQNTTESDTEDNHHFLPASDNVIKSVDSDISENDIREELENLNLTFHQIWRIKSKKTDKFTSLIRVPYPNMDTIDVLLTRGITLFSRRHTCETSHASPPNSDPMYQMLSARPRIV